MSRQKVAVLGSTGSIGEQALSIMRLYPERFEVVALAANRNWRRLAEQARQVLPSRVVVGDSSFYTCLKDELKDLPIEVSAGGEAVAQVGVEGDTVVNAIVGWAGLESTLSALRAGKRVALANKESLVVAGELVMRLAAEHKAELLPVDSEHSAILQCLAGESCGQLLAVGSAVRRVILTASGGALRDVPVPELRSVTAAQALAHPNWSMGPKITIDSATLVNKGFEVVEARWLFGLSGGRIDVLLHPQSIVHSMVEFHDGAIKAQLGTSDMRVPIAYALSFPERLCLDSPKLSLEAMRSLTFGEVDPVRYPALGLVRGAMEAGGTALCALNAANEVAVAAFLEGRIGFLDIVKTIEHVLERVENVAAPVLGDYVGVNSVARRVALESL